MSILFRNSDKINKNAQAINKIAILEKYTVKEKARQIITYLKDKDNLNFNDMYSNTSNAEMVTAFLSSLELSKLKQININQECLFSDIFLNKNKLYDANYDFSGME